jgi:HEAT repeat protein
VDALLTQAAQERNPDVLAAIISALGPASQLRGDFRTVEALLLASLEHESFAVSRAAADSFKALAGLLRDPKNRQAADLVAQRLQERLRTTDRNVAAAKLRESIVEALAELAHPSSRVIFQQLLNPGSENPIVRIWALRGLRNIADPDTAQGIVNVLSNDPDRGVRLQAAEALLTTARYANIQQIYPRLNENLERDSQVRAKVWEVMVGLFEQATPEQLENWAEQFRKGTAPENLERRLVVLTLLERKLAAAAAAGATADSMEDLAVQRQNLGDVLLRVGKPEEASIRFLQALEYWKARNAPEYVKYGLVVQTMTALLQAKQDAQSVAFGTQAITQNQQWEGELWNQVKAEVLRRQQNKDNVGALALIREARKVPWLEIRTGQLDALEKELQDGGNSSRIVHEPRIHEHAARRIHAG